MSATGWTVHQSSRTTWAWRTGLSEGGQDVTTFEELRRTEVVHHGAGRFSFPSEQEVSEPGHLNIRTKQNHRFHLQQHLKEQKSSCWIWSFDVRKFTADSQFTWNLPNQNFLLQTSAAALIWFGFISVFNVSDSPVQGWHWLAPSGRSRWRSHGAGAWSKSLRRSRNPENEEEESLGQSLRRWSAFPAGETRTWEQSAPSTHILDVIVWS